MRDKETVNSPSSVFHSSLINNGLQFLKEYVPPILRERQIAFTSVWVTGGILCLKLLGAFQAVELSALDQIMRLRPAESGDDRIIIVGLDEKDISELNAHPIADQTMANVLNLIKAQNPRVIGLDIYRDLTHEPGGDDLQEVFRTTPNLVGIERLRDSINQAVAPPEELSKRDQIGFNNVLLDKDGRIRRGLLYWTFDAEYRMSFGLKIALQYLEKENITSETSKNQELRLDQAVFPHFQPNDGGYVREDNGGYQILANFRNHPGPFQTVSFSDILSRKVSPTLMTDRIVLVGSTAPSLKDVYFTSYNGGLGSRDDGPIAGVEVHAQIISQILSASLDGRPLFQVWPDELEALWIFAWILGGASLSWYIRRPATSGALLLIGSGGLFTLCYVAALMGWWIPLVTPLVGLGVSAIAIISHIAHLEGELQKSKEFLNSVINAIPDPIFVKDKDYQWVVLNEAYCQFLGYSKDELLGKGERHFLPPHQVMELKSQDDLAFATSSEQESEGEITNAHGHTYAVAMKRTLHHDNAGNLFLVGVIHDITHRKRMEEELRRTAAELVQSNAELRQVGDNWRKIAYHDPLTGLPNRKLFQEKLIQAVEWAEGTDQIVALLFLDLDGFKIINDTQGHVVGDLLLQSVAQRLKGCLRNSDTVARLGGDEFVVILTGLPGHQVSRVTQKILDTLAQSFVIQSQRVTVTTSVGVSLYPFDGKGIETLIVAADQAMYRSKERGKNQYTFASHDPSLPSCADIDDKSRAKAHAHGEPTHSNNGSA